MACKASTVFIVDLARRAMRKIAIINLGAYGHVNPTRAKAALHSTSSFWCRPHEYSLQSTQKALVQRGA